MFAKIVCVGLLALYGAGCTGVVSVPLTTTKIDNTEEPQRPDGIQHPEGCRPRLPAKLWKLTPAQLKNTLEAFAPGTQSLAGAFGSATGSGFGVFRNDAARLDLSLPVTSAMSEASEAISKAAVAALPELCNQAMSESDCLKAKLRELGQRAYRRPLSKLELDELADFYTEQRTTMADAEALRQVAAALVLSPEFLFRSELGQPLANDPATIKLTAFEAATRLSYGLTDSPPDEELFTSAARGDLTTYEGRAREARRLLALPSSLTARTNFFKELFQYEGAATATKDVQKFPDFSPDLGASMVAAADRRIAAVLSSSSPQWSHLLTDPEGFVDARLAKFYRMTGTSSDWRKQQLPPQHNAGLLSEPAVLAALSGISDTHPVHRGHFLSSQLLCIALPSAPPGVPPLPSETAASPLMRDRLAIHSKDPFCAGCHRLMDPGGLLLETFDAVGQYRKQEAGHDIDSRVTLNFSDEKTLEVKNVGDLALALSTQPEGINCVVQQQTQWVLGVALGDNGICYQQQLVGRFKQADRDLNDLLVHLIADDELMYRER